MLRPVNISIYEKPFPLRFLAGHSSTCSGLFPASSVVPEIKNDSWFPLRGSLFCKDLSMTLFRDCLHSNRVVDNYNTSCIKVMRQPFGQPGPPFLSEEQKDRNCLGRQWTAAKNIHSTGQSFWLCLFLRPQTWLPSTSTQRWGLTESLRGTKSPTELFVFL